VAGRGTLLAAMDSGKRTFYLGRYNCIEQLGTGPLGETYRAKIYGVAGFEKQFAVKRLHPQLSEDESFVARFVQAASAFAGLENSRIARVHEVNAQGAHYYIVVDLVRGLDVRKMLDLLRQRGEALAPDIAMTIAADVAESLEYAHGRTALLPTGVLHLGLTAASVMTTYDGEVKLVDFGLTAALVRPGWSNDDVLTPTLAYLPPEVWRGEGFDGRADVFSLGVLLHEMVGGSRVFLSDQAAELRGMIESGPPSPPAADPRLQQIITRALQPDPGQRFASAAEMRAALEAIVGGRMERARADLGTLVRRLAMPRERRTGAFASVTLSSDVAGALTPLGAGGKQPPPIPGSARPWAPPVPKPPIGPLLSPVPLHNTIAGIGPDDVTVAGEAVPASPGPPTEPAMSTVADDAETRRVPRDDEETNRLPRTDAAEVAAKARPVPPELPVTAGPPPVPAAAAGPPPVPVAAANDNSNRIELVAMPATDQEALPPPIPTSQTADDAVTNVAARPTEASGTVHVAEAPEESWTPLPLAAPPPSPPPTFASGFEVRAEPMERPRSSVPGTRLPPRNTTNRVIVGGIAALATLGVAAVYVGLTMGRRPDEKPTIAAVQGTTPSGLTAGPETKTEPSEPTKPPEEATPTPPRAADPSLAAGTATQRPPTEQGATRQPAVAEPRATGGVRSATGPATGTAQAGATSEPAEPGATKPATGAAIAANPAKPPAAAAGAFTIASTPAGAAVFVDGEARGSTPVQLDVSEGRHKLVVAGEHQKLIKRDVEVKAGGRLELTLEPARLPSELSGHAGLKVRCHSQGELRILVDGTDTGLSCPNDERISVAPGTHKIGLYSPRTDATHEVDHEVVDASHSTRVYVKF
jgi:hypothetical protein